MKIDTFLLQHFGVCDVLVFCVSICWGVAKMWKTNNINNDSLPPKSQNWANGFYFQFWV